MSAVFLAAAAYVMPVPLPRSGETVTYTYDVKGRLTNVSHAGGPADAATAAYRYDAADNRAQLTVSSAKPLTTVNAPPVIVVPLNGLRVIVLQPDI